MERDFKSLFQKRLFDRELPNSSSLTARLNLNHNTHMGIPNGTLPISEFSQMPQFPIGIANEPNRWFNSLPAIAPMQKPVFHEKPFVGSNRVQKSFLVFDQTGDQTTLFFSSGINPPVQFPTSWNPKLHNSYHPIGKEVGTKIDPKNDPGHFITDDLNEDYVADLGSDMREDTEELNALLYSDDDDDYSDYSKDGEVTSTDHTPSTMTCPDKQDSFKGCYIEEVASSDEAIKGVKPSEQGFDVSSTLINMVKRKRSQIYCESDDDDAQSSCVDVKKPCFNKLDLKLGKIRETISVLQRIIPGGKGKDGIDVLDEAIQYLKFLKNNAKDLGLYSI